MISPKGLKSQTIIAVVAEKRSQDNSLKKMTKINKN